MRPLPLSHRHPPGKDTGPTMANFFFTNRRELEFLLFEHLKIQDLEASERYSDFGRDDYSMMVDEAIRFCTEVVAPLNEDADRIGARFEDGVVTSPPGFIDAYRATAENGWMAASQSPDYGGMGLPEVMGVFVQEMFLSACTAFQLNMGLTTGAGHLIESFGTDAQKALFVERMYAGKWAGTMVLTEPGAGSDLNRIRTTATPTDREGVYAIEGTKSFITAGDHDLAPNIIHLVLAMMPDGRPGTRSLGLFIVPKIRIGDDGSLGEANDVQCTGIEHKMGIHGSPTCSLSFGESGGCEGYLLGSTPYQGMKQMFQMMNEARIMTGMQGIGLASVAYENARRFAQERVQGSDISRAKTGSGAVPIIRHADVRRMLLLQKSYVEGMRALAYNAGYVVDQARTATDDATREALEDRLALLTPIVKAFCTDNGFLMCSEAIQVFGGYGYCGEYPAEQATRDARIAPLYEGTNFIQAADLLGRKLPRNGGAAFQQLMADITEFVEANSQIDALSATAEMIGKARDATLGAVGALMQSTGAGDFEFPMSVATRFLHMLGELFTGWQLGVQARLAHDALAAGAEGDDAVFYEGKIITARFFAMNVLPGVRMKSAVIRSHDTSAMDMPEAAF